jgi:hypothetical protein
MRPDGKHVSQSQDGKVDTAALGTQMAERKSELMDELGMEDDKETKVVVL